MRSPSAFSSLIASLLASLLQPPLPQSVAERDAIVEDKTFASPAALRFRHAFEIIEDTALEVIDLGETARQQIARGLFAANAAGAEHRDPPLLCRIEMAGGKILELRKTFDAGIDRAHETAHRDFECIAGIDQQHVRIRDQVVPVGRLDIGADLPGRNKGSW